MLIAPTINVVKIPGSDAAKTISRQYQSGSRKYNAIRNAQIINNATRNELIKQISSAQEQKGKTNLIFVDRIAHGNKLAKMTNKPFLNGQNQSKKNRERNKEIIEKVKKGEIKTIIATQQLFGEGFDLPAIDSLIIADAGGKSKVKTMQRAGRALRTKSGKKSTDIYKFDDQIEYLNEHTQKRVQTYKEHEKFKVKKVHVNDLIK